jgi:hypothetical protein
LKCIGYIQSNEKEAEEGEENHERYSASTGDNPPEIETRYHPYTKLWHYCYI